MRSPVFRRAQGAGLIALLLVVLTGCMRMHTSIEINADDTVSGSMIMAYSQEFLDEYGITAEDLDEQLGTDLEDSTAEGVTVEAYSEDGYTGNKVVFDRTPFSELGQDSGMSITRQDDQYVFTADLGLDDAIRQDDLDAMGLTTDAFDIQFAVTFPYGVTEHNGELSGNTVTWKVDPTNVQVMEASGPATGSSLSLGMILAIAAVALAAIALVVVLVLRSRKPAPAPAAPDAPVPGTTTAPAPYPTAAAPQQAATPQEYAAPQQAAPQQSAAASDAAPVSGDAAQTSPYAPPTQESGELGGETAPTDTVPTQESGKPEAESPTPAGPPAGQDEEQPPASQPPTS